jgi:hypothetical protein
VFLLIVTADCPEEPKPFPCTEVGQNIMFFTPMAGATVGLGVAVVGTWIWPRTNRVLWLSLGWILLVVGILASCGIAEQKP